MIKKLLPIVLLIGQIWASSYDSEDLMNRIDKVIPILIEIESNGDLKAIGDNGRAKGQLQIWEVVIKDVNNKFKTNYKHDHAFYYHNSCEIAVLYLYRWASWYERKYDKEMSLYDLGRLWNSGPKWFKKKHTTENYVRKMKRVYESII